ncbi:MAG: hypothetical protein AB1567_09725 [bacterium]
MNQNTDNIQNANKVTFYHAGNFHKTMRMLISFLVGVLIFSELGWLTIHSSMIPYNVPELFNTDYPLLSIFLFSGILYWCFGIPVCLAWWITMGEWKRVVLFPFLVMFHGAVSYGLLRITVPMECIHDIVGISIHYGHSWELELLGRFVALFAIFSLFLTGGVLVSFLLYYDQSVRFRCAWRWLIAVVVLLPISHWVVIKQASTDNLTELLLDGGCCLSTLLLSSWIFIIACSASMLSVQSVRYKWYSFLFVVFFGLLSFPLGYYALHFGTEQVIYKYGHFFSAMQFLLCPDRANVVVGRDLVFRYAVFQTLIMGIIIITQYPFWTLIMPDRTKNKG